MLKLNRRQFLQSSWAAVAVAGIPALAIAYETGGPEEAASLVRRIRLVSDFQIRGYSNGGPRSTEFDRDFEIGQILTKEDVDGVSPYPYDVSQPGWFEMLTEQGLAVPI